MPDNKCEHCANYEYDEEYECYVCTKDLDEDEMEQFMEKRYRECPYFDPDDEYKIVRHQM